MTVTGAGDRDDFWAHMESRGPATVTVGGTRIGAGSRVRLRPRSHADVFDMIADGRTAVVEAVEQDESGRIHLAVTLEDDPGRDLGEVRLPGHRFFYAPEDVEPLPDSTAAPAPPRVLVAGVGNVFLGDDGFGVEVVRRLAGRITHPGVDVVDFGIRGMDLAYALQRDYQAVIFVDAAQRGEPPGTLTVVAVDLPDAEQATVETHGMDPVRVLRLAQQLGRVPERVLVVCCEPATVPSGELDEDLLMELSEPVRGVLPAAVEIVESLVDDLCRELTGKTGETANSDNTSTER